MILFIFSGKIYSFIKIMIKLLTKSISRFTQVREALQYPLYTYAKDIPTSQQRTHWNLFQAVNSALDIAL